MSTDQIQAMHARIRELEADNARLRAQALPAETQERYRFLFDTMDEGFCVIEFIDSDHGPLSDYVHVLANPAYAKHAGIDNVVGQRLREMVPAEADAWLARYGHVLHSGEPIRFEQELVATGRYLDVTAFRMEPASRHQVAVLFQDVTPRKRAERALKELNETLEQRVREAKAEQRVLADVVDGASAMIHVFDHDYRWLAINGSAAREFERLFGVRPERGENLPHALGSDPERVSLWQGLWARALRGEVFSQVLDIPLGSGVRHYELEFNPLFDAQPRQIGAYLLMFDVTERVREQARLSVAEEALRQSQRMEAVGQLTGGIAHDFNNLLTAISGSLELLLTRLAQGRYQELERLVGTAHSAARRAASLTHRLLAFSRRQTLEPRAVDTNRLVVQMEELIRRSVGPSIELEVVTAAGLWTTFVDPPQLENALLNLCLNARDAMPGGGRITLETANRWIDEASARQRDLAPGQYISLSVSDAGCGMAAEVVARAFEPFFTTKPLGEGTGLGLSMVYGFVRQSGGQVRIYSEEGLGTTMCLYLPRHYANPEEEALSQAEGVPTPARAGQCVLVVDDEHSVRMLVAEVLSDLGYQVIEAADAAAGLKVLRSSQRVDLLISDVGLPGGMNGRDMAQAARQVRPSLGVLFITGYAENSVIGHGQLAPGMRILTKPFTLQALARRIEGMLAGQDQ